MAEGILNPIQQLEAEIDFDVYTKQEVDVLLDEKADKSDTYTKTETDALLNEKADADSVYTKTETDSLLDGKADKSTTLAGYGITDAYTQTETDNLLSAKADADSVYTKQEIDTKIPNSVGSATKPVYVNGGVITAGTYELNKTVPANAVFTDTTYSAGNGLNLTSTTFSAKAGTNVTVDASGINVNGNGVVASADTGLLNGGTAYTELRPTLDGTWVKNAQTTGVNLQKLEGGLEYLYGLLSKQYDQLKKYVNGNYYDYDTDTDAKYVKNVPANVMPYASLDSVGGKTVVFNQLVQNGNFADTSGWYFPNGIATKTASNNVLTVTFTGSYNHHINKTGLSFTSGHHYYVCATMQSSDITTANISATVSSGSASSVVNNVNISTRKVVAGIFTSSYTTSSGVIWLTFGGVEESTGSGTIENVMIVDLTLAFGSGNEPSTVAEFQQMFPAQYYSYNAGTLLSAGVTEVVSNGQNEWNSANIGNTSAITVNADGSVTISGYYAGTGKKLKEICPNMMAGKTYILHIFGDNIANNFIYVGSNIWGGNNASGKVITQEELESTVNLYGTSGSTITLFYDIVEGNTAPTEHIPYKAPISYPIPVSVQLIEGYGCSVGSVYNYVDFEAKKFIQRVASVDLGSLNFTLSASALYMVDLPLAKPIPNSSVKGNIVCPKYTNVTSNNITGPDGVTPSPDMEIALGVGKKLYINNLSYYRDIPAFTSAMSGVYMNYELATPVETDISAYLTDDNLISVESGGTLTFPNSNGDDYRIDVPSSETYMVDLQSAI